jgi:hypothetical protein
MSLMTLYSVLSAGGIPASGAATLTALFGAGAATVRVPVTASGAIDAPLVVSNGSANICSVALDTTITSALGVVYTATETSETKSGTVTNTVDYSAYGFDAGGDFFPSYPDPGDQFGSIANGSYTDGDDYSRTITSCFWTINADELFFAISGTSIPNTDRTFCRIIIDGISYARSDATYWASIDGCSIWVWNSVGVNPFAGANPDPFKVLVELAPLPVKSSYGSATLPAISASGSANRYIDANGAATIEALTSTGNAKRIVTASGAPTLQAIECAGSATALTPASGAATVPTVTTVGQSRVVRRSSGAAIIASTEANGAAARTGFVSAFADVSLAAIESSGAAEYARNASGAASIAAIETNGAATVHRVASGAINAATVEASGAASVRRIANGAVDVPTLTAAASAVRVVLASGSASIIAVDADGAATVTPQGPALDTTITSAKGVIYTATATSETKSGVVTNTYDYSAYGFDAGGDSFPSFPDPGDQFGSIANNTYTDGNSNSRTVTSCFWSINSEELFFALNGTSIPNTNATFEKIVIDSIEYTRSTATHYSSVDGCTIWVWNSIGTNPFAGTNPDPFEVWTA